MRWTLPGWPVNGWRPPVDTGGNSHHPRSMPIATTSRRKRARGPNVVERYDVAADAKSRISLRKAKTKYFHVKALSNGSYLLEPRVLVPPHAVSAKTRKMLDIAAANLKQGKASVPVDLTPFLKP